jgi:hypothetical protein
MGPDQQDGKTGRGFSFHRHDKPITKLGEIGRRLAIAQEGFGCLGPLVALDDALKLGPPDRGGHVQRFRVDPVECAARRIGPLRVFEAAG